MMKEDMMKSVRFSYAAVILIALALLVPHSTLAQEMKVAAANTHQVQALQSCHKDCSKVRASDVAACQKLKDDDRKRRCIKQANDSEDQCDRQCEKKYGPR